uniref:tRNA pseudouridine(38/39) synthase n=1 Tax=Aceria tosichella TaxID=561515 RepID=A0A6G1SAV4_9ACAR
MNETTKKKFDLTKFKQRHIALKILYFGWDYDGLADQANSENTVEYHIITALIKTCLIESRQKSKFNRCGRTDKGVSSYGQVIDLNVRSNLIDETQTLGLFTPDDYTGPTAYADGTMKPPPDELKYVDMLNGVLPTDIRVIAWAPVGQEFSSRFSCQSRSYSYVFPKGDLCIESMKVASKYLIGSHDFRNLCSFDLKNGVTNHVRTIYSTSIRPVGGAPSTDSQYSFYEFIIVGRGFLYHQIRCIMTILFLVARKREVPEVVRDMLDINKCPARPKYCPASPLPLSLFDCEYSVEDLKEWQYNPKTLSNVYKRLKQLWLVYKTKTVMIERALFGIEAKLDVCDPAERQEDNVLHNSKSDWKDFGLEHDSMSDSKYIPIMRRQREDSLEKKLETMNSKPKKLKRDLQDEANNQ